MGAPIKTTYSVLLDLAKKILSAAGFDDANTDCVARHLARANLSGVDSHGVCQLIMYVESAKNGEIVTTARPSIVRQSSNSLLVSGNWGLGQLPAEFVMQRAIEKAREHDVAVASLVQAHHIGRLGEYVEMAAENAMISFVMGSGYSESVPIVVPFGGREKVLHTNPLAIGFPAGSEPPMFLDFATSATSGAKLTLAYDPTKPIPENCIVDKDGKVTTKVDEFKDGGALLPFGGHKGYAIMLAVEFMGRILSGSIHHEAPKHGGHFSTTFRHQGITMIVFKADLFRELSDYQAAADEMIQRVHRIQPAEGFTQVLVPGDLETQTRVKRQREGIPIPYDMWQKLMNLAKSLSVPVEMAN